MSYRLACLLCASQVRLNHQRSPSHIKVQGHIALQHLTEGQHGLEILKIEGDISSLSRQVLVAQEHLVGINCQLSVQQLISRTCNQQDLIKQIFQWLCSASADGTSRMDPNLLPLTKLKLACYILEAIPHSGKEAIRDPAFVKQARMSPTPRHQPRVQTPMRWLRSALNSSKARC